MSRRPALPLYIACAYDLCGRVVQVKHRGLQQRQRFCSHRCANLGNQRSVPSEACRRGGLQSVHVRRLKAIRLLAGLTALQAFRLGYQRGFESAKRQIRAKYVIVRRETSGRTAAA